MIETVIIAALGEEDYLTAPPARVLETEITAGVAHLCPEYKGKLP